MGWDPGISWTMPTFRYDVILRKRPCKLNTEKSLLSLPYLGFVDRNDPTYKKTREYLLSSRNPYYAKGSVFGGIRSVFWSPQRSRIVNSSIVVVRTSWRGDRGALAGPSP